MPRLSFFVLLCALPITACKIHRLDTLPTERDPTAPAAPITDYEPPPDVLTRELSKGDAAAADPHAGHNMSSEPAEPSAAKPSTEENSPYPPESSPSGHEGHGAPVPKPDSGGAR